MSETTTHDTRRVELDVTGMTCASCVARVERKLQKLPGVEASVNLPLNMATVEAPVSVSNDQLTEAVSAAGYDSTVRNDSSMEHHHDAHEHSGHNHMDHGPSANVLKPRLILAVILTVPLFIISMFSFAQFPHWGWVALVLATPVTFISGWPFHKAALKAAKHGSSTMDTLVSIGVTAAWLYSTVELILHAEMTAVAGHHNHQLYYETAGVVTTFLLLGRFLEARAKNQAGEALKSLLNLGAKTAVVLRDGLEVEVPVGKLAVGDQFVVRPGEKIATDGTVTSGHSAIDTSLITGESVPKEVSEGDTVTGATINTSGRLVVTATRTGSDTTLAQMGKLVADAQSAKAPIARLADRISGVFVPIVLAIALVTLILWLIFGDAPSAIRAAVTVLVIACPCALGLATPVGLLAGTGRASQLGILIRGPEVLEDTRGVDSIVLDKTGTVTEGRMAVVSVEVLDDSLSESEVLTLAGAVEAGSEHPIAKAIVDAARDARDTALPEVMDFHSTTGGGVRGSVDLDGVTHAVFAGATRFMNEALPTALSAAQLERLSQAEAQGATVIWVGVDQRVVGLISLQDTIKDSSAHAIARLTKLGLTPILLTGDNSSVARQVAEQVGVAPDNVFAEVKPADKVSKVRELQDAGRVVAMVGDGVNDAPALAQADLGIAMASGTDVAQQAADITVMGSNLTQVTDAVELSRKTLRVIKSNLFWAFAYNTLGIPVAAFGLLNPMVAGAAMAASSVLVVANSLRLTRFKR